MKKNILSLVVIFYKPEPCHINNVISLSEHYDIVVVDNTPEPERYDFNDKVTLITLNDNVGIAKALNLGIEEVKHRGYQYCLLLDQDSVPSNELIQSLLNFYHDHPCDDIAVVAPCYHDKAMGANAPFIKQHRFKKERIEATGSKPIDASFVISSASLINLSCYDVIGPMNEELFIDHVDIEWGFRANSLNYRVVGLPWLKMEHEIGGEPVIFFGKKFVNHSAIRHYYYLRNVFMLLRLKHIPTYYKLVEVFKLIPRLVIYSTVTNNRLDHFKHMVKGIYHGMIGRFGKLDG